MSDRVFLDTYIIIYLYSEDEDDKRDVHTNTLIMPTASQVFK